MICKRDVIFLPSAADEAIFSRDQLASHDCLSSRRQTPAARPEGFVQNASVLDLREVEDSVWFDFDVVWVELGLEDCALLGGEGRAGEAVVGSRPVDLALVLVEGGRRVDEAVGQGAEGGGG